MTPPWWAAFPATEATIRCGTGEHVLRWADGQLSAASHADAEGELVLAALGGDRAECVAMLEAWGAHAADLDVLALGPRSPGDELAVTWELVDELRALSGPAARSVPMRPGPAPGPPSGGPGTAPGPVGSRPRAHATPGTGPPVGSRPIARPIRGLPGRRLSPEQERARAQRVELLSLFALSRAFQLRLSAQVASAWSAGPTAGTPNRPGSARPALTAALAGGWPRPPGRGSASTPTRSGPRCTRVPAGAASRGTGPGYGPRSRSAGWPGSGRRVSPWWTATWSWTCWRPAGHGCRCSGSQPRGRNPPS